MQSTYNLIKQFVTNKISYLRQPSLFTLQHAPNIKSNLHWLRGFKPTSVKDRVLFNSRYVRLFNYILTHYIRILTSSLFALCRSATCKKNQSIESTQFFHNVCSQSNNYNLHLRQPRVAFHGVSLFTQQKNHDGSSPLASEDV